MEGKIIDDLVIICIIIPDLIKKKITKMPEHVSEKIKRSIGLGAETLTAFMSAEIIRGFAIQASRDMLVQFGVQHQLANFSELSTLVATSGELQHKIALAILNKLQTPLNEAEVQFYLRGLETYLLFAPIMLMKIALPPVFELKIKDRAVLELFHTLSLLSVALLPAYSQIISAIEPFTHDSPAQYLLLLPYLLACVEGADAVARLIKFLVSKKVAMSTSVSEKTQSSAPTKKEEVVSGAMKKLFDVFTEYGIPIEILQDKEGREALQKAMSLYQWTSPEAALKNIDLLEGGPLTATVIPLLREISERAIELKNQEPD
jgi:hypothetical protein